LFFECNFSERVWNYLQINWTHGQEVQMILSATKLSFGKPFFMEVLILSCWSIWKQRNGQIFQGERPTFSGWKRNFLRDVPLLEYRIKQKHLNSLLASIGSLQ
jgi:hypothetical protein